MRLLILPSWYPRSSDDVGGVFFRDQALALANRGVDVVVLAPQRVSVLSMGSRAFWRHPLPFEDDAGVKTYRRRMQAWFPVVPFGNAWLWKRVADRMLQDHVREHGWPDLVHAHSALFAGWCAAGWHRRFGLPFVLTEHRTVFSSRFLAPWHRVLARRAIGEAEKPVVVSPALGTLMEDRLRIPPQPWRWIPNVVSHRFRFECRNRQVNKRVRFLNLGIMTARKGQSDLIHAYARAFGNDQNFELLIGGDGPMMRSLRSLSRKLGIADNVTFLGSVNPEDVPALMNSADVFVLSSHYETFGVVVAEALVCGLPVIATRCGGPESILEPGDGVLVAPKDPVALSEAMRGLADRLPAFDAAGIAHRAESRFSSQAVSTQLIALYEEVLNGRGLKNT